MCTTLSTTQISAYTTSCWLYPCTPRCLPHKYQHIPHLADCIHAHHIVYHTNISIYHILLTVSMHTTLSTTQISAYTTSCWLHPCTPRCPPHKYQHIPHLADCIHVHHVVYHTNISIYHILLTVSMHTTLSTTQISAYTTSCWLSPCTPRCLPHKYQHIPHLADCIHAHHVVYHTNISIYHILMTVSMYTTLSTTQISAYTTSCWLYPCTPRCVYHTNISIYHILLTVSMYTTLSTTQISAYTTSCWLYPCTPRCLPHKYQHIPHLADCIHAHHVVHHTNISIYHILLTVSMHTTLSTTQISAYTTSCWLYPCTPRCPPHKYQHIPHLADCIHAHHVVHHTNISIYHILLTVSMYTTLSTTQISAYTTSCWLYPCTPRCLPHKYQHIPHLADCIHAHHVVYHTNISIYHILLTVSMYTTLSTTQISAYTTSCWLYPCTPRCLPHKYQHIPHLADCIHVHHVVHHTNISIYHILLTVSMHTTLSTTQISAYTTSCWLYPCTPRCPPHKYQHIPHLADCIHAHHVVHHTNISIYHILLTVSMYTTLSTTQISAYTTSCWLYPCTPRCPPHKYQHIPHLADCIHVHHVVYHTNISIYHILLTVSMYTTLSTTQISAYTTSCWLYPCTPRCPPHKYQHIPHLVDCIHVHHVVYHTNISIYHILLTVSMYTTLSTTQISAYTTSCWLYPCTPRCPPHKYQHIPHLADCIHVHHVVHHTNISIYHILLTVSMYTTLSTTQISAYTTSCWLYPCTPRCPPHKYQHIPHLADCIHVHHVVHHTNISIYHILLTVSMYTTLSTTQISAYTTSCWLYPCTPRCPPHKYQHIPHLADCIHVHHVVYHTNISIYHILLTVSMHTTLSTTQISAYTTSCWLYPCTPRCPPHKYLTVSMYTTLSTTQISAHTMLLLLLTVPW